MRVLALEPYFGGSHQAFLSGWQVRSRHTWTTVTDRPCHWKWRMRHAAVTMAQEVSRRAAEGASWDVVWASSMVNLAEFRGLCPAAASLPAVLYFHENQITYPVQDPDRRDIHFGISHLVSSLAADAVWFNSSYHKDAFFSGLGEMFGSLPRPDLADQRAEIAARSSVAYPGVSMSESPPKSRSAGPVRISWASRWEYDKGPDTLFAALRLLMDRGVEFEVIVLGEQFRQSPSVFSEAREWLGDRVRLWGYQPSRGAYESAMCQADVFVSTAEHEFFGLAAVEAATAGVGVLLPNRLAYPEVFSQLPESSTGGVFYDGSAEMLADRLTDWAHRIEEGQGPSLRSSVLIDSVSAYQWTLRAGEMDAQLEGLAEGRDCLS
jgi:glycosyltransferase involved in cell wall biosynthesis